ncbi:unnamed protein product [Penicillium salamii]|nr:unnamed protein product [Penicillium salamii]CAG8429735.1 unnamed protein product [Penicillium salamii]
MSTNQMFEGWLGLDCRAAEGKMVWGEFEPKQWEETDVDIQITHCGVCGSDTHTLRSGWGSTNFPCCVGHEIVGIAVRVGSKAVGDIQVGDRVGVGAQSDACLSREENCEECNTGQEKYCTKNWTGTYNGVFMNGEKSYGGYALYNRCPSHFVIKIPDGLSSAAAAPMLCAGITTFTPLKKHGCGPGKRVGVIGVGGLGHFALLFAKALGADQVVAISRGSNKKEDAMKMGADLYISTQEQVGWSKSNAATLDLIISTVDSPKVRCHLAKILIRRLIRDIKMPLTDYFTLLKANGVFVQLGVPDGGMLPVPIPALIHRGITLAGSLIGSPHEIRDMLQVAAEKNIQPWIEERPMEDANQVIIDMEEGKARYRYVLVNEQ